RDLHEGVDHARRHQTAEPDLDVGAVAARPSRARVLPEDRTAEGPERDVGREAIEEDLAHGERRPEVDRRQPSVLVTPGRARGGGREGTADEQEGLPALAVEEPIGDAEAAHGSGADLISSAGDREIAVEGRSRRDREREIVERAPLEPGAERSA